MLATMPVKGMAGTLAGRGGAPGGGRGGSRGSSGNSGGDGSGNGCILQGCYILEEIEWTGIIEVGRPLVCGWSS
jgi:hypothetical protein